MVYQLTPMAYLALFCSIFRSRKLQRALLLFLLMFVSVVFLCLTKNSPRQITVVYSLQPGYPLKYWTDTSGVYKPDPKSGYSFKVDLKSLYPWPKSQRWSSKTARESNSSLRYRQCQNLLAGKAETLKDARDFMINNYPLVRSDLDYIHDTRNCPRFLQKRGYILDATEEERAFPLAFSIVFYHDMEQMERLLRAVYRPQNIYCVHLDKKSDYTTWRALRGLVSCFPNVFIASKPLSVEWGQFSVLEPELVCMRDLWANKTWRYFINLTGQEYPLKTNLQLVNILTALNGSNDIDCTLSHKWDYRWVDQLPAPHSIIPRKGNLHIAVSRDFVDYVLHSNIARDLLTWLNTTGVPDETFFSSLNYNPHLKVPGAYLGPPETDALTKPYLSRYKNWGDDWIDSKGRNIFHWPCHGKRVRFICIFGVGDLPMLTSRWEMFANKLFGDFEPLTLDCLEEWLWNVTMDEYSGRVSFDTTFYGNLDSVKNHIGQFDRSWTKLERKT